MVEEGIWDEDDDETQEGIAAIQVEDDEWYTEEQEGEAEHEEWFETDSAEQQFEPYPDGSYLDHSF